MLLRPAGAGYELLDYHDSAQELPQADMTVAGFDSGRVAFYPIKVPPVKDEQMNNLINMQAETLLPLPIEQMDIVWRAGEIQDGKIPVTIAAARSVQMEKFFQETQDYQPSDVFLVVEAVVKAWCEFYAGGRESAVIVYIGAANVYVCLARESRLVHAVTLDVGREELLTTSEAMSANLQRFSHDLQNALQLFDIEQQSSLPVYLLCPDLQTFQPITGYLAQMDLNVQATLPNKDNLTSSKPLSAQNFYDYLIPVGLALMALDNDRDELKLFRRLLPDKEDQEKKIPLPSVKTSAILAGIMVVVFIGFSFFYLGEMEGSLNLVDDPNIDLRQLQAEHNLKKTIAQERTNLLELIEQINACVPSRSVQLDEFDYKKGQQITVTAHTRGRESIYEFQNALLKDPHFKDVRIQSQIPNERNNEITFTLKFEYANIGAIR